MQLAISDQQCTRLLDYIDLLCRWNRVFNLTAVRDPVQMISRHLLDSLSILSHLHGNSLLDIGTGAGLPGIPVAIMRPDIACKLLDSNGKKTRFVQQAVAELKLSNVQVFHDRIEKYPSEEIDTIVSRAFSSPIDILSLAHHLCAPGGIMLFMLAHPDGLLDDLPEPFVLEKLEAVHIPFENSSRHLAVCRNPENQSL